MKSKWAKIKAKYGYWFSGYRVIGIGFALLIIFGACLLHLPIATRDGRLSWIDAFFTATSASCVTGLAIADTYMKFSLFGQIVILTMIQIGGLGFMVVAMFFSMVVGKRIGLRERALLMNSLSALRIGGIVKLTRRVVVGTIFFEAGGTLLLATRFVPRFGFAHGIWYSIFHSVSAFCNAGFSLTGCVRPGASLAPFSGDPVVMVTVMVLIAVGGLGFLVWNDLAEHKLDFKRYQLHTKIMLVFTLGLIVIGALLFFIFEYHASMEGQGLGYRIIGAFFQSVTPRTAGFNTTDMRDLSSGGTMLTLLYMFIGAGSGSTGGGIKVTTCFVIVFYAFAFSRGKKGIDIFNRRVDEEVVRKATANMAIYGMMIIAGILAICSCGFNAIDSTFEVVSALGTVGLSRGITESLPLVGKLMIILLMYSGRVGSMSVAMAVSARTKVVPIRHVSEQIIVG